MECYYQKDDETFTLLEDVNTVLSSYPNAVVLCGRTHIQNSPKSFGVYEQITGIGPMMLLGMGRTEEEAWYSASKVVQELMLRRLERNE